MATEKNVTRFKLKNGKSITLIMPHASTSPYTSNRPIISFAEEFNVDDLKMLQTDKNVSELIEDRSVYISSPTFRILFFRFLQMPHDQLNQEYTREKALAAEKFSTYALSSGDKVKIYRTSEWMPNDLDAYNTTNVFKFEFPNRKPTYAEIVQTISSVDLVTTESNNLDRRFGEGKELPIKIIIAWPDGEATYDQTLSLPSDYLQSIYYKNRNHHKSLWDRIKNAFSQFDYEKLKEKFAVYALPLDPEKASFLQKEALFSDLIRNYQSSLLLFKLAIKEKKAEILKNEIDNDSESSHVITLEGKPTLFYTETLPYLLGQLPESAYTIKILDRKEELLKEVADLSLSKELADTLNASADRSLTLKVPQEIAILNPPNPSSFTIDPEEVIDYILDSLNYRDIGRIFTFLNHTQPNFFQKFIAQYSVDDLTKQALTEFETTLKDLYKKTEQPVTASATSASTSTTKSKNSEIETLMGADNYTKLIERIKIINQRQKEDSSTYKTDLLKAQGILAIERAFHQALYEPDNKNAYNIIEDAISKNRENVAAYSGKLSEGFFSFFHRDSKDIFEHGYKSTSDEILQALSKNISNKTKNFTK